MKVMLSAYNPNWPQLFEAEKAKIIEALSPMKIAIEPIGSTAIPGIWAKPVIDILIGVENVNDSQLIPTLQTLGYRYQPVFEQDFPHRRYFQKDNPEGVRTHQIHVVRRPSASWFKHLLFRDYLRTHPVEAQAYGAHKQELAKVHQDSVPYASAKTHFCQSIDRKAYFDFSLNQPVVSTERLQGYVPQLGCFELYESMFQDETFSTVFGIKHSKEKIMSILSKDMALWDEQGFGPYVWFEPSSGEFIGRGGLNRSTPDGQQEIELAYALKPPFWNKGYATEIGKFSIHQAFEGLKLPDLVCFTSKENVRSARVMEKLGFQHEKDFVYAGILHRLSRLRRGDQNAG